jgi:hypothetical protein
MRRRIVIVIVFSFAYLYQYGQFKITGDKDFKNYSDSLLRYAGIQKPDFAENDFEMRLWIIRYVNQPHAVFVFKHSKIGKWSVKSYNFCTTDWIGFNGLNTDSLQLSQYWNSRWDSLIKNQILRLPSENKVLKKWKSSTGIIPVIADGLSYRIELFTAKKRRRYSYNNPEDKLPNYDLNNKELVAINKIVVILNSELQFKQKLDKECH